MQGRRGRATPVWHPESEASLPINEVADRAIEVEV